MQDQSSWAARAAERSPTLQRSRTRSEDSARAIVAATRRVLARNEGRFTVQGVADEAGIALQTLYAYFPGKDHLLLAVFEDLILEYANTYQLATAALRDPIERLRMSVTAALEIHEQAEVDHRFMTREYWRLYEKFPDEMARALEPFAELTERHLCEANAAGQLASVDPAGDAWIITKLVLAVYHDCAFGRSSIDRTRAIEKLWGFCLTAVGGR